MANAPRTRRIREHEHNREELRNAEQTISLLASRMRVLGLQEAPWNEKRSPKAPFSGPARVLYVSIRRLWTVLNEIANRGHPYAETWRVKVLTDLVTELNAEALTIPEKYGLVARSSLRWPVIHSNPGHRLGRPEP